LNSKDLLHTRYKNMNFYNNLFQSKKYIPSNYYFPNCLYQWKGKSIIFLRSILEKKNYNYIIVSLRIFFPHCLCGCVERVNLVKMRVWSANSISSIWQVCELLTYYYYYYTHTHTHTHTHHTTEIKRCSGSMAF